MLDLGLRARVAFTGAYAIAQGALIAFGLRAPDHVFAFQMFNESSRMEFQLLRRVRGRKNLVPVVDDTWRVRDSAGASHEFHWRDRVRCDGLTQSGLLLHAPYGAESQLFRLQAALEDMVAHIPDDRETRALVAVVQVFRNGRPQREVRLVATRR